MRRFGKILSLALMLSFSLGFSPGLGSWSSSSAFASDDVSGADIEALVAASGDFPKDRRFSCRVSDGEAFLATYVDKDSTQPEMDSKVDAVLLARRIIQKYPSIIRVVADFYSVPRRKTYRQVAVTKAEILGFAGGQVSQEELLRALRVEQLADSKYTEAAANTKPKMQDRADAAASAASAGAVSRSGGTAAGWTSFDAGRFVFEYPSDWSLVRQNDGETILKISKNYGGRQTTVELEIVSGEGRGRGHGHHRRGGSDRGASQAQVNTVAGVASERMNSHARRFGYQLTKKSGVLRFGAGSAFTGMTESYSRPEETERVYEECVYFGWTGLVYRLEMECSKANYKDAYAVFGRMLSTMSLKKAGS